MTLPSPIQLLRYAVVLLIGGIGGMIMSGMGAPMPFLIGGLLAVGAAALANLQIGGGPLEFPIPLRTIFIVVIGVLIGGAVSGDIWGTFLTSWPSFLAVLVFVVAAQAGNYVILRRLGGYDPQTAFFAGTPGGLIESITLGEEAGGDPRILTLQQFSRIVIVITTVPFLVSFWHGSVVGSAAGVSFDAGHSGISFIDAVILAASGGAGLYLGRFLKLPAAILTGPIIASALVHGFDLTSAHPPGWLITVAQWIVGSSLGMRFAGTDRATLTRALGLALISGVFMLSLGVALAALLSLVMHADPVALFIIFAPGGVTEMGLIALSLNANPFFVTLHHLLRIGATVILGGFAARYFANRANDP